MVYPRVYGEIFDAMSKFRINNDFCDVKFVVQNKAFYAHKVLLAASSEYFRAMFLGSMQENAQFTIPLHDVNAEIFTLLIDFIYGTDVNIESDNVEDILVAADMFRITDIVNHCETYLTEHLDVYNCIGIYCLAKQRFLFKLEKQSWVFIMRNFYNIFDKEEFLDIPLQMLSAFTCSEEIAVKSEKDVLQCVVRWLSHNPRKRRGKCVTALKNVRKNLLTKHDVTEVLNSIDDICLKIAVTVLLQDAKRIKGKTLVVERPCWQPRLSAKKSFYMIGGCTSLRRHLHGHNELEAIPYVERYDSFSKTWDRYPLLLRKGRTALAAVHVDRKIYAMGGEKDSMIYGIIECYNTTSKTWEENLPSMIVPRTSFQAVAHGNDIYVIGGDIGTGAGTSIEVYNTVTNQCKLLTFEMQTARHSFGAVCCDNIIYMAGGVGLSEREIRTMECYDLQRHDWWFAKDMISKRANFNLVCVASTIYAIGGHNKDAGTLRSVEKYDTYKNIWLPCASMNHARAGAFASVMNSKIVVVGGKVKPQDANLAWQILSSSEIYDCETDTWIQCQELSVNTRCDGAAVVM